jgi:uncharacterized membrane protein YkgB
MGIQPRVAHSPLGSWMYDFLSIRSFLLGRKVGTLPAGWFPAMQGNAASLMKDFVLLAASVYLLKQALLRLLIGKLQSGVSPHQFSAPGGTLGKSA